MKNNFQVVFQECKKVELQEREIPKIDENNILVKSEVTQISIGTELSGLELNVDNDSEWRLTSYPKYPGYSNVGIVVDVGKNVDKNWLRKRVLSYGNHSTFNNVDPKEAVVIPEGVTADEAAFGILGEVCLGGFRMANMRFGDVVVVYGAGLVGQLTARLAKTAGSNKVFVVDVSDFRLSKVPDDDCFIKINSAKENPVDVITSHNNQKKADIVFETTGAGGDCVNEELKCLEKCGKLIILSSPKHKSVVDLFMYCCSPALSIIGAGNFTAHADVATDKDPWTRIKDREFFLELLKNKRFDVTNMITNRESYKQAVNTYTMLMEDRTKALGVHLSWE